MKKLIAFLCTLTCILGLTACGTGEKTLTAFEQEKLTYAQDQVVPVVLNVLELFMDDSYYDSFAEYTNEETEAIVESSFGLLADGYGFKTAMESFHLSGQTTGSILEIREVTAEIDGSKIIVNAKIDCEKKDAVVELILSNDIFLKLEGGALNPVSTRGELLGKAGMNTLLGMGTVFVVLILISLIIASFGLIPKIQAAFTKKNKEKVNTTGIDNAVAQIVQQEEVLEETDDTELVAVIAAAVAAYEGSTNTEGFVVRSIRRR